MASGNSATQTQFLEQLVETAKKAFDPGTSAIARGPDRTEYQALIDRTDGWSLISALNTLIKPGVLPAWLRTPLLQTLAEVPLRPKGVRATLEFVFSVHPSSKDIGPSGPQKEGASITHEAVAVATKLLSSPPQNLESQAWFDGLSSQFFSLMDGDDGPELANTAAQIVGFGILGRKQYGAPGSAGWNAFVQPMITKLNPSLVISKNSSAELGADDNDVIDLTKPKVVVKSEDLSKALNRLSVLILSNPSPGLCMRVLKPVLLQLWSIASWVEPPETTRVKFCEVARSLIQTYLRLFGKVDNIRPLLEHLLVRGSPNQQDDPWIYSIDIDGIVIVTERQQDLVETPVTLDAISAKASTLVEMVANQCSAEDVSFLFLHLLKRWIQSSAKKSGIKIELLVEESKPETPVLELVEVTVLQKLMDKCPEQLVAHFAQLLELITHVLQADQRSSLDDDLVSVALSLLHLVITAPTFQKSDVKPEALVIIEESLERLGAQNRTGVSDTARNFALLLRYHDELEPAEEASRAAPSTRQVEDRRTYNLAMSYITGAADNPPPVVSEGLNLLSGLITTESPALDITTVTALMSALLKENEDYINLRVVKIFTQLANKHPKTVMDEILDHYLDAGEKLSTDNRLRFGEALLQVMEKLGETFSGETAQRTGEILLSIAGRRGYRPKTMTRQAKDEKRKELKRQKERAAGVEEESDDDLDMGEELSDEQKANNNLIAQILQGWESKRGSEDLRMRASALSIFGSALETNMAGVGATLVSSSVDLCVSILSLEREMTQAILRRAAIISILQFARALHQAREAGRSLGFGLTDQSREEIKRTLEYVGATDNDGLVRQHASDTVETLEALELGKIGGLGVEQQGQSRSALSGLSRLAGLVVNPVTTIGDDLGGGRHPRIEELE